MQTQVSPAKICEANNLLTDAGGGTAAENEKGCLLYLPQKKNLKNHLLTLKEEILQPFKVL